MTDFVSKDRQRKAANRYRARFLAPSEHRGKVVTSQRFHPERPYYVDPVTGTLWTLRRWVGRTGDTGLLNRSAWRRVWDRIFNRVVVR